MFYAPTVLAGGLTMGEFAPPCSYKILHVGDDVSDGGLGPGICPIGPGFAALALL